MYIFFYFYFSLNPVNLRDARTVHEKNSIYFRLVIVKDEPKKQKKLLSGK